MTSESIVQCTPMFIVNVHAPRETSETVSLLLWICSMCPQHCCYTSKVVVPVPLTPVGSVLHVIHFLQVHKENVLHRALFSWNDDEMFWSKYKYTAYLNYLYVCLLNFLETLFYQLQYMFVSVINSLCLFQQCDNAWLNFHLLFTFLIWSSEYKVCLVLMSVSVPQN